MTSSSFPFLLDGITFEVGVHYLKGVLQGYLPQAQFSNSMEGKEILLVNENNKKLLARIRFQSATLSASGLYPLKKISRLHPQKIPSHESDPKTPTRHEPYIFLGLDWAKLPPIRPKMGLV